MDTSSSHARTSGLPSYLALAHAAALVALTGFLLSMQGSEHEFWFRRLYVGLVTLWFLWPIVLALHPGRSVLRLGVVALLSAILLWPSLRFYNIFAPEIFGLPIGMSLNPLRVWKYFGAYRAGGADTQRDVGSYSRPQIMATDVVRLPPMLKVMNLFTPLICRAFACSVSC